MSFLERNWDELIAESEYEALLELKRAVDNPDKNYLQKGIDAFLKNYINKTEDEVYAILKELAFQYLYVLNSDKASENNIKIIDEKRCELTYLIEENNFINEDFLSTVLDDTLAIVINQLEAEGILIENPNIAIPSLLGEDENL